MVEHPVIANFTKIADAFEDLKQQTIVCCLNIWLEKVIELPAELLIQPKDDSFVKPEPEYSKTFAELYPIGSTSHPDLSLENNVCKTYQHDLDHEELRKSLGL